MVTQVLVPTARPLQHFILGITSLPELPSPHPPIPTPLTAPDVKVRTAGDIGLLPAASVMDTRVKGQHREKHEEERWSGSPMETESK